MRKLFMLSVLIAMSITQSEAVLPIHENKTATIKAVIVPLQGLVSLISPMLEIVKDGKIILATKENKEVTITPGKYFIAGRYSGGIHAYRGCYLKDIDFSADRTYTIKLAPETNYESTGGNCEISVE